jgi:hypothetical protein
VKFACLALTLWLAYEVGHVEGRHTLPMAVEARVIDTVVHPVRWPRRGDPMYAGANPMTQAHVDSFPALTGGL